MLMQQRTSQHCQVRREIAMPRQLHSVDALSEELARSSILAGDIGQMAQHAERVRTQVVVINAPAQRQLVGIEPCCSFIVVLLECYPCEIAGRPGCAPLVAKSFEQGDCELELGARLLWSAPAGQHP